MACAQDEHKSAIGTSKDIALHLDVTSPNPRQMALEASNY